LREIGIVRIVKARRAGQCKPSTLAVMSYLKIQTNLPLTKKAERTILKSASTLVAVQLGKPEDFVMVAVQPDTPMMFAGSDEPVAFLELKSVGLPGKATKQLSAALCGLIKEHLGIPSDRVYVKFIDVRHGMWGWKGDVL
jgi:phenylpyruvate tautomerase PptA (4-oxalocrotonate tautomerase family)